MVKRLSFRGSWNGMQIVTMLCASSTSTLRMPGPRGWNTSVRLFKNSISPSLARSMPFLESLRAKVCWEPCDGEFEPTVIGLGSLWGSMRLAKFLYSSRVSETGQANPVTAILVVLILALQMIRLLGELSFLHSGRRASTCEPVRSLLVINFCPDSCRRIPWGWAGCSGF